MNKIVSLSGYSVIEEIFTDSQTSIYRGIRNSDAHPVTIEILRDRSRCFNKSLQLQNQYTIGKLFDLPNIVKTLALEVDRNQYTLILEDFGGISLADRLRQLGSFGKNSQTLTTFLHIAIQIADALDGLYCRRVIHKDIKPANILINPETQQIKLTNFGIASLLPREIQEIKGADIIEGTLAYISPEQTGRMNRGIDYRTDFYALGVTFYELLTGQLPFAASDPMELIHSHLARSPVSSHQIKPEIPLAISQIVSKLMSKNPPDRYQSALGLKYDLNICLAQLKQTNKIELFTLGERDFSDRFLISEQFYGRELEIVTLIDAFERVSNGKGEILVVAGSSGIGKSAIVQEIHKPIVSKCGYFITGKYDQLQRNIPFSAFVEAFRDLIRQLFCQLDEQKKNWKVLLLTALGENGQVLIDLIPELEIIIGKQLPAPELSSSATEQRFNLLIKNFVRVFATAAHPLVLFLDDLQWADLASLNLLQLLMQDATYLLIIAAYRDNEVSSVHPSISTLNQIQKTGTIVNTITLKSLSRENLNQLIADTLNCDPVLAEPLSELVNLKTKGNPFFTNQFLKALHQDGLISFQPLGKDGSIGGWRCDFTKIKAFAVTDDVVEFMALQLQKLPAQTQTAIALAAAIGAQFDLNTLAIVLERSTQDTAMILWAALQQNLLLPTTEIYKFFPQSSTKEATRSDSDLGFNPVYRFLHDRIQQAAYSLIPDRQKPATHLKIGQLLRQNLSDIGRSEKLFDIIGHLNLATELITDPIARASLAKLNLTAGTKARNATAYGSANNYLQIGIELLPNQCWETEYQLMLDLHIAAAEAAYLHGNLDRMEQMSEIVLKSAQTILDKVDIYRIQIAVMTTNGKMLEAIAIGRNALAQLGIELPLAPDETVTRKALQTFESQLEGQEIEDLLDLPVMNDRRTELAMKLFTDLSAPIFSAMPGLCPVVSTNMVSLSLQFGNTSASTLGYINYALVLSNFFGEINRGYRFGKLALKLTDRFNSQEFKAKSLFVFANWIQHRSEALHASISNLKYTYIKFIENGDFPSIGYSINSYFDFNLLSGVELNHWEQEISNILNQEKQYSAKNYLAVKQQLLKSLTESGSKADLLVGSAYDETVMIPKHLQDGDLTALAYVYIYKLMLAYLFNKYTAALENISQADRYLLALSGMILIPVFHFYAVLTHLALATEQSVEERVLTFAQVEIHQGTIDLWAENAPMNYLHKWHLIEAEKQRVLGNKVAAIDLYDLAIAGAKEHEFIHEEALANELAMKFYLDWGKENIAKIYAIEAYQCYDLWGAKAKTTQLIELYPQLLASVIQEDFIERNVDSIDNSFKDFDLNTLIEASNTISDEVRIDLFLEKLLKLITVSAGVDKCALILKEEDDFNLIAILRLGQPIQYFTPLPFELSADVPISILNNVKTKGTKVILDINQKCDLLKEDPYLLEYQPQSALCMPIVYQSESIGLIYLENTFTPDLFTDDRLKMIQVLIAQSAVSIKNTQLYTEMRKSLSSLQVEFEARTKGLKAAVEIAESANRNKTIFFTNMSHELRTPLNAILGMSDALKTEGNLTFEQQTRVEAIESSGAHLLETINDILDLAKVEAGKLELHCTPTNIDRLCNSTLVFVKQQAFQKQIKIELDIQPNLPDIMVDERRIRQVLINLLSNAVKFTPVKGHIRLEVKHIVKSIDAPSLPPAENTAWIEFAVTDTGIGIAPANIDRLFQPFSQIDSAVSRQAQGTGLGLNLVREMVEMHGGRVSVTSKIDVGSRFAIDLPLGNGSFVVPLTKGPNPHCDTMIDSQSSPSSAENTAIPTIIIIEDNISYAETISNYLKAKRYNTIVAKNAKLAIDLTRLHHPDSILMSMPISDGLSAIEQLRNDPQFANLPIIILSASDLKDDLKSCLAAGASKYLNKPISLQLLAATIQNLLIEN